jgi:hypothetical protein
MQLIKDNHPNPHIFALMWLLVLVALGIIITGLVKLYEDERAKEVHVITLKK